MRIALDLRWVRGQQLDGISRYALNLVTHLAAAAPEHDYLVIGQEEALRLHLSPRTLARIQIAAHPYRLLSLNDLAYSPRVISQLAPHIFHAPHYLTSPFRGHYKKIVTVFDLIPFLFPKALSKSRLLWRIFYRFPLLTSTILRSADAILTASEHTKRDIIRLLRVPADQIHVVWCGLESRFREGIRIEHDFFARYRLPQTFLLYVGRQDPYKGLAYLVDAAALLPDTLRQTYRIVIAGKTDERYIGEIHALIARHHLQDAFIFLDYVPDDDLPALYSAATLLVHPSLYEGFGFPPLEAMACGTPVVYANTSSLSEHLGAAGFAVAPASAQALACGIQELLDNPQLRQQFSMTGHAHAQRYSWDKVIPRMLQFYQQIGTHCA